MGEGEEGKPMGMRERCSRVPGESWSNSGVRVKLNRKEIIF